MLRSIGYRGRPVDDIPFDERRGLIRNDGGRVVRRGRADAARGEYVVGWIKRGPSGVIGTNKKDAADTVARIVEDREAAGSTSRRTPIRRRRDAPGDARARARHLGGLAAIDAHERAAGEPHGRPRVKLVRMAQLREVARSG